MGHADDDEVLETMFMPKEADCLRMGYLQKKSINTKGVVWDKRMVCLTDEMLLFARVEDSDRAIIDYINLTDVVECELKDDEDPLSVVENSNEDDADTIGKHADRRMLEVIFRTYEESRNCGRSYIYRSTERDARAWEDEVDRAVKKAKDKAFADKMQREHGHSAFAMARARWKHTTESFMYQSTVAAVILFAFLVDILDAQLDEANTIFTWIDLFITLCFVIELFSNLFANSANHFKDFFAKYMNWFDVAVVFVSLIGVYLTMVGENELVAAIKVIRIFRVLKVLPMVKKLASFVRLVQSIGSCLLPMGQAFLILFVMTLLYSVLGVHLFSQRSPEYFKDLSTALFSLHQVVMGDSWSSAIARSLFLPDEDGVKKTDPAIAFYFVSYILTGNVLLLSVVVAVLLDEFLANVEREKEHAAALAEAEAAKQRITGVLDPITSTLTNYQDADDLAEKMDIMYTHLDADGSGGLNFDEFREGIKRLPGTSRIHMTKDDFDIITEYGLHLGVTGEFDRLQFRAMMRGELFRYARRGLANVLRESSNEEFKQTVLMLKMIETNIIEEIRRIDVATSDCKSKGGHHGQKACAEESDRSSSCTEEQGLQEGKADDVERLREAMADVTQKLHQVAQGQKRLEAHTSRMDQLHKIPELVQKLEHVLQGLECLNTASNQADILNAIPQLKRATVQSVDTSSSARDSPIARVETQVQVESAASRAPRARSRGRKQQEGTSLSQVRSSSPVLEALFTRHSSDVAITEGDPRSAVVLPRRRSTASNEACSGVAERTHMWRQPSIIEEHSRNNKIPIPGAEVAYRRSGLIGAKCKLHRVGSTMIEADTYEHSGSTVTIHKGAMERERRGSSGGARDSAGNLLCERSASGGIKSNVGFAKSNRSKSLCDLREPSGK